MALAWDAPVSWIAGEATHAENESGWNYPPPLLAVKRTVNRAPGMALQYITTKEPTADMLEVAIASFNLAMSEPKEAMEMVRKNREETADKAETAEALAGQA